MKIMNFYAWALLCMLFTTSCSDKENQDHIVDKTSLCDFIVGEWVADNAVDDPMGYRWEILKFLDSGQMYFSNYSSKSNVHHEYVNGTYTINENDSVILTSCILGWNELYQTNNTTIKVSQVSDYGFKAELLNSSGELIETKNYKKVISNIELKEGEMTPDYEKLFKGKTIKGYKSHNDFIASVDSTGKIKRGWSGSTYIDVETDEGTALIHVAVNTIFYFDYLGCIGKTKDEIIDVFDYGYPKDNYIYYLYNSSYYPELERKSGNWEAMGVLINPMTELVEALILVAKEDVVFTEYQLIDYLKEYYTVYEEGTEDGYKAFLSGDSFANSKVGIAWDSETKVLSFISIQKRSFVEIGQEEYIPDYKELVGDATIKQLSSRNEYIATVDKITGMIKGIDSGKTIIDILTDQGTASIHLTVKVFVADDYESLIGESRTKVNAFYGVIPYTTDDNGLLFTYNSLLFPEARREVGNWESMLVKMSDILSGSVTEVILTAKDDVWFTAEEMNQYLAGKYSIYNNDVTETVKAYLNSDDEEKATVEVLWDMTNKVLTYKIFFKPKPTPVYDFGRYMGKTRDEAKEMMISESGLKPLSDSETSLIYMFGNENVQAVTLFFNSKESIQTIQVRLGSGATKDAVIEELNSLYTLYDSDIHLYLSKDNKIRIYYLSDYNMLKYQWN